jgi:hypothetical protein
LLPNRFPFGNSGRKLTEHVELLKKTKIRRALSRAIIKGKAGRDEKAEKDKNAERDAGTL